MSAHLTAANNYSKLKKNGLLCSCNGLSLCPHVERLELYKQKQSCNTVIMPNVFMSYYYSCPKMCKMNLPAVTQWEGTGFSVHGIFCGCLLLQHCCIWGHFYRKLVLNVDYEFEHSDRKHWAERSCDFLFVVNVLTVTNGYIWKEWCVRILSNSFF